MYKAILFDLDDTLLRNEMNAFVQAYWGTLIPKISQAVPGYDFKKAVMAGTQAMIQAQRSSKTLRDVFIERFEHVTALDFADIEPIFEDYYQNEYRRVEEVTERIPLARKALEAAQHITSRIALATIPIFPEVAIRERLRWAGLADMPFQLITSFEIMHASKPNPDYFSEIAELLAVDPGDCLMIGNDYQDDMPAMAVGMKTFLVSDYAIRAEKQTLQPDFKGSMVELIDYLNSLSNKKRA